MASEVSKLIMETILALCKKFCGMMNFYPPKFL